MSDASHIGDRDELMVGSIDLDYKQTFHWARRDAEKEWESARVAEKIARKVRDTLRMVVQVERYNEIHGGEVDQAKEKTQ